MSPGTVSFYRLFMKLRSERVVTAEGVRPGVVEVRDGRIVGVHDDDDGAEDLGSVALLPGLVDPHVHINEPGRTEWEGFVTATRAAAVGGITTLVDMPLNCIPVTTSEAALATKREASTGLLHVDCAFWGGVVPGNASELLRMVDAGAAGFKAFLCHSGIDDFPDSDRATLREAMRLLRDTAVPLLVHAELEDPAWTAALQADLADASDPSAVRRAYRTYLHSRPSAWEDAAIAMMIELIRETGCRVHVVHLSSASALPLIRRAKADGLPLTVETCPHYLCLTAEEVPDGATEFKCAPPIREAANREALWAGLRAGTIDFVVSDHSPCTPGLKLPERGDFLDAWGGIASLQLGLGNVWTEARRRGFGVADVVRWMATAPAAFLGLRDRGVIRRGARADLVAWDPDGTTTLAAADLHHRHPVSPYVGRATDGRVLRTWRAGRVVAADGEPVGRPGGGALLREES